MVDKMDEGRDPLVQGSPGPKKKLSDLASKKVKASHARYRALGPELIPVYRQSTRM